MGVSGSEIFVILLFVLIFFGAGKIPELARSLGKGLREFKKAADDIKSEINNHTSDIKNDIEDAGRNIKNDIDDVGNSIKKDIEDADKNIKNNLNGKEAG